MRWAGTLLALTAGGWVAAILEARVLGEGWTVAAAVAMAFHVGLAVLLVMVPETQEDEDAQSAAAARAMLEGRKAAEQSADHRPPGVPPCGLCAGWGRHEGGKCLSCDGRGYRLRDVL